MQVNKSKNFSLVFLEFYLQTLLILMRNMKLMLTKTPPEDIKQYILPVVYNALDAESPQVQV